MKPIVDMDQGEVAAFVQNHLRTRGIDVVLSGGAVVGIYTNGLYVSRDVDLVNVRFADRRKIEVAMREIGFVSVGRHFEHPDTIHIIEFPSGPLTLGDEKVVELNEISLETGKLIMLTPTDCVRDRLSHYFHWGDQQCLAQAKLVADHHDIYWGKIREWAKREGQEEALEGFKNNLI